MGFAAFFTRGAGARDLQVAATWPPRASPCGRRSSPCRSTRGPTPRSPSSPTYGDRRPARCSLDVSADRSVLYIHALVRRRPARRCDAGQGRVRAPRPRAAAVTGASSGWSRGRDGRGGRYLSPGVVARLPSARAGAEPARSGGRARADRDDTGRHHRGLGRPHRTESVLLDVAMVMALVGFLGTVAYARYIRGVASLRCREGSAPRSCCSAPRSLLAAVGVVRMPDVFTRMQAATKAASLGAICMTAGRVGRLRRSSTSRCGRS